MNSRDRLLTSLHHEEPDRVPSDFGAASTSGIKLDAYQELLNYLDEDEDIELIDKKYQTVLVSRQMAQKAGSDAVGLYPSYSEDWQIKIEKDGEDIFLTDEWGIKYKKMNDGSFVNVKGPLEEDWPVSPEQLTEVDWPQPIDDRRLSKVKKRIQDLSEKDYSGLMVMNFFTQGLFELSTWLAGYEEFLTSLLRTPEEACGLLDKLVELKKLFWKWTFDEIGDNVDVVKQNDDLGEKQKPIISPDLYRKYLKPRHKELHNYIKSQAPKEVFILYHSDGAIFDLIEDFIDTGVDILNPVQLSAKGMEPRKLKERFGDSIVFWGGGIDVSDELPQQSPAEVKATIKKRIEIFGPDGGFVFAPTQSIQSDVPPENILAIWEALEDYGKY